MNRVFRVFYCKVSDAVPFSTIIIIIIIIIINLFYFFLTSFSRYIYVCSL